MASFDLVFRNRTRDRSCTEALVRRVLAAAMPFIPKTLRSHDIEIGVVVVGPVRMRALNKKWRSKNAPTDVLSFPLPIRPIKGYTALSLGDVFICPAIVRKKANEWNRPVKEQMQWTVAHGILHLCGYDHERNARAARTMAQAEQRILKKLKT